VQPVVTVSNSVPHPQVLEPLVAVSETHQGVGQFRVLLVEHTLAPRPRTLRCPLQAVDESGVDGPAHELPEELGGGLVGVLAPYLLGVHSQRFGRFVEKLLGLLDLGLHVSDGLLQTDPVHLDAPVL